MSNVSKDDIVQVVTAAILQLVIATCCFVGFSYLRTKNNQIYEPKVLKLDVRRRPEPLGGSFLEWLHPVFRYDEDEMMRKSGVDSIIFLRFTTLGCQLFAAMTTLAVPMMVVNYYAPQIDSVTEEVANPGNNTVLALNALTMNNVAKGSSIFYIHAVVAYIFTGLACYLLYKTWIDFIEIRRYYYTTDDVTRSVNSRTLLLTNNIPRYQDEEKLLEYLKTVNLNDKPQKVIIGRNYSELTQLVEEHRVLIAQFETILVTYLKDPKNLPAERPLHKVGGFLGIKAQKVDSIMFYSAKLKTLEKRIYELRAKPESEFKTDSSAFIAFFDVMAACRAETSLKNPSGNMVTRYLAKKPQVKLCPTALDIVWENIGLSPAAKKSKSYLATGLYIVLVISWVFLMAFISSMTNLISTSTLPASLGGLVAFLNSIIAPLLAAILNALLPMFLRKITKLQGVKSISGIERSSLYKYFVFMGYQFIVIIATSVITSFIIGVLGGKIGEIQTLLTQISQALAAKSTYFITLTVTSFAGFGIEIIQGAPLIITWLKRKYLNLTPRESAELDMVPKFDYMPIYGSLLLAFLLGFSYSIVAPLILPFCAFSFFLADLAFKYQLTYVYETETESGGAWLYTVFNLIIAALVIFQLTTLATLAVITSRSVTAPGLVSNNGAGPNILILLLPFFTIGFWAYITYYVKPRTEFEALHIDVESSYLDFDPKFEAELVKARLFNPAVASLLPQVWVEKEMEKELGALYKPEFTDVIDYVTQTDPDRADEMRALEKERAGFVREPLGAAVSYDTLNPGPGSSFQDVVFDL